MIQLQSILLPTEETCKIPELYFRKTAGRIDFNGYFNLFYLEKRKKYTVITNLFLTLRLKGYQHLILVHNGIDLTTKTLEPETEKEYCFEFPYAAYQDGLFWFSLVEEAAVPEQQLSGAYTTLVNPAELNQVTIGINICTYKRENYLARNLSQITSKLLNNQELNVSGHLKVFIIDNGQTLAQHKVIQKLVREANEDIQIYPNKNAGGTGGFTRGMLEILRQKEELELTHVLIMDDDAIIETDSLVRLYGLLITIRAQWQQAAVGGGIFREDYQEILFTAGEWWEQGTIITPSPMLDMTRYENCTSDYMMKGMDEYRCYSGWWCCCYPLTTVTEQNLPLPLFIHLDDIEYGLRNQHHGIIYLNGIDVWHRGSELTMPRTNLYYDARNSLILIALYCGSKAKKIARNYLLRMMTAAILRLKYRECKVIYRALEDFLKGPGWLTKKDPAELLSEIHAASYQLNDYQQLNQHLSKREFLIIQQQIDRYCADFGLNEIHRSYQQKKKGSLIKYLSYNGWLLPARKEVVAISVLESPFASYRRRKIVLFEPISKKYLVIEKRYRELLIGFLYHWKALYQIQKQFATVQQQYLDQKSILSSAGNWREYLNIKASDLP